MMENENPYRHKCPYFCRIISGERAISRIHEGCNTASCNYLFSERGRNAKSISAKFPDRMDTLNRFLTTAMQVMEVVPTPDLSIHNEKSIRDQADRPIFRAAIINHADIILTGDKDFLESDIEYPKCISPSDFLNNL